MVEDRKLIIHIKKVQNQDIIGFELEKLTKDEAIVILNRCLFRLLDGYDEYVDIKR